MYFPFYILLQNIMHNDFADNCTVDPRMANNNYVKAVLCLCAFVCCTLVIWSLPLITCMMQQDLGGLVG